MIQIILWIIIGMLTISTIILIRFASILSNRVDFTWTELSERITLTENVANENINNILKKDINDIWEYIKDDIRK